MRVHQKNGRAAIKHFVDVDSKKVLKYLLEYAGFELLIQTGLQTDWGTPMREFSAYNLYDDEPYRSIRLDIVERGCRPDWQGMWDHFQREQAS